MWGIVEAVGLMGLPSTEGTARRTCCLFRRTFPAPSSNPPPFWQIPSYHFLGIRTRIASKLRNNSF